MAYVINKAKWRQQPTSGLLEVDLGNPLTSELVFTSAPGMSDISLGLLPNGYGGLAPIAHAFTGTTSLSAYNSSSLAQVPTAGYFDRIGYNTGPGGGGIGRQWASNANIVYKLGASSINWGANYTLMFLGSSLKQATRKHVLMMGDEGTGGAGGNNQLVLGLNVTKGASVSSGYVSLFEYNSGFTVSCDDGGSYNDGNIHVFCGRRSGSTPTIWRDGVNITVNQTTSASTVSVNPYVSFGSQGAADRTGVNNIRGWFWQRGLDQGEIEALADNPWQDCLPHVGRRFYLPHAAAVAVTGLQTIGASSGGMGGGYNIGAAGAAG